MISPQERRKRRVEAESELRELALVLCEDPAIVSVIDAWPAPIAHELKELLNVMKEHESPDSCLLQLRDFFEVTIKYFAAVLAASIEHYAPNQSNEISKLLLSERKSLGTWNTNLLSLAHEAIRINGSGISLPSAILSLSEALTRKGGFKRVFDVFSQARNSLIGHAARSLDPRETAAAIEGFLRTGVFKKNEYQDEGFPSLHELARSIAGADWPSEISPFLGVGEQSTQMIGVASAHDCHNHEDTDSAQEIMPPLFLYLEEDQIPLAPYVATRPCSFCSGTDLFLFDSIYSKTGNGKFDFVDYLLGHMSRLSGDDAPDVFSRSSQITLNIPQIDVAASLTDQEILEALDHARIDRNYLRPDYLRAAFVDFVEQNESGAYWLRAPAHTGKTTFALGIVEPEKMGETKTLSSEVSTMIVGFFCRKEHRPDRAAFVNSLQDQLLARSGLAGDNIILSLKPIRETVEAVDAKSAFSEWLDSWLRILRKSKKLREDQRLVIVIDGLDEAPPPGERSMIDCLPDISDIPEQVIFLLTSRQIGEEGAPEFLSSHVAHLLNKN